jgi:hypothetical protein
MSFSCTSGYKGSIRVYTSDVLVIYKRHECKTLCTSIFELQGSNLGWVTTYSEVVFFFHVVAGAYTEIGSCLIRPYP